MGKKARKTRWRTLTIDDNEYSDSEESSTTTTQRLPKGYQPKSYYNKSLILVSQRPRRRYQHDSTKSTRSSSTASENKITFNEDEYTKITTPRQDVLFKKGYLNKPKNYQTQTSTGTSTTSTGNSTGNGTPDHQSTDLEYESQFVFPNGFVDQNGIYYINSYETYPLMLYNPPTYYPEFSNFKSKRYSTGSLTESTSPNNEEATSQDFSGGEASNNVSDYSGHHQVYNMVYPGYYVNGVCPPHDAVDGQNQTDQTRRIKKRRRRKTSKSQTAHDSSEYTEDENDSCNEESQSNVQVTEAVCETDKKTEQNEETPVENVEKPIEEVEKEMEGTKNVETKDIEDNPEVKDESKLEVESDKVESKEEDVEISKESPNCTPPTEPEVQEATEKPPNEEISTEVHQSPLETKQDSTIEHPQDPPPEPILQKSELKPDAEEFIPRAYRNNEIPINPNLQFIKVPPNFIPIPIVPLGDFNGQNYNPTFIPSGIPINFLPPDPKLYPNFVGFVPNAHFVPRAEPGTEENCTNGEESVTSNTEDVAACDNSSTANNEKEHHVEKVAEKTSVQNVNNKTIDIATIVSKLEEAAKEQDSKEAQKLNQEGEASQSSPRRRFDNKNNKMNQKYKNIPNYRRNNYNSAQNSPQRNIHSFKANNEEYKEIKPKEISGFISEQNLDKDPNLCNGTPAMESRPNVQELSYTKRNSENRRNWKFHAPQTGSPKWQPNSPVRNYRPMQNNKPMAENSIRDYKFNQQSRNYSATVKNKTTTHPNEQKPFDRQVSEKQKYNQNSTSEVKNENTKTPTLQPKQPNQWISVSSRKKRKNKNPDESEVSFEENDDHSERDLFEKYDVNQLVDVVPPTQEEEEIIKVQTKEEIEIGDIINTITQNEASLINNMENISLNLMIRSVDDIEKELIVKDPVETETLTSEADIILNEEEITEEKLKIESVAVSKVNSAEQEEVVKAKNSKKSKKGTQKPTTKRVIITDVDLSMQCEEVKTPSLKKIVTKVTEQSNESVKVIPTEEKIEKQIEEEPLKKDEEEEKKKGKKKKKKPSKTTIASSLSSSNTTINNMDDSYDFLLDSALSPESVEKSNVEISQELDKIIQKGMYSSLEEKVKSLNIDDSDGFFKSVFSNLSNINPSVDKNSFNKTLDLTKALQDSRSLFRPSSVSEETNSHNRDFNKVLPDLDSPDEDGIFLENTKLTDTLQGQIATNDKQTEETPNEDTNGHYEPGGEIKNEAEVELKILYPITEAVKEWMSRTRETTPDVEILKSPDAIYKEFCDSASETDTVVSDSTAVGDEEITIFTKDSELNSEEASMQQQDLMEYWENDFGVCELKNQTGGENGPMLTDQNNHIEQGEDVLEVYDSKYGNNEDYLNLQREIKEKVNNSNHAKHGNLPYRAICCSIM
uniref:Uncharacterized protein n=1 Tax=Anoplophora glabripennis TaxID=217634 RepID=V5GHW2_ANOGL